MKYTYKNNTAIMYLFVTIFVSFLILIFSYLEGGSKYGIKIGYIVICIAIWIISLILLWFALSYIEKNIKNPRANIILYIVMLFIFMGSGIAMLTGYIIAVGSMSIYYITLGYLAGVVLILPEMQYFAFFLHHIKFTRILYVYLLINLVILGGGFVWAMW